MCLQGYILFIEIDMFIYLVLFFSSNPLALIATFGDINAAVERLLSLNQLSLS